MAKKKLSFKSFEKCRIPTSKRQKIKGGYKYIPQGAQGSNFIISLADIRNENLLSLDELEFINTKPRELS